MSIQDQPAQTDRSKPGPSPAVQTSRSQEQLTVVDTATTTDQGSYPSGIRLWMAAASCCTVSFLHGLDLTIVAATVPSLTNHFKTVADIGWYSSAYALMTASFSFSSGKLYSILPLKRLFIASLCIFQAGSLVCAAAATSWMFILGRAVAGIGSAGLVSGSYMTITHCFPSQKRAVWTTVVGSSQFMGVVSAPLLGGVLIDWVGWRACFGINVPLGVVAYLMMQFGFQEKAVAGGGQNS